MRTYAYVRKDPNRQDECEKYTEYQSYYSNYGYDLIESRIIVENVSVHTSIKYRDKINNLINYSLEERDLLIIKGIDSLGKDFNEINKMLSLLQRKKIRLVCLDFSVEEIEGEFKDIFLRMMELSCNFEILYNSNKLKNDKTRKVGRPEILNDNQKEEVIEKFKQGYTIYSLAKEYSVTRTVIQRLLSKKLIRCSESE